MINADAARKMFASPQAAARHEEHHITVDPSTVDPIRWHRLCVLAFNIKPLYIELNDHRTQLMCAVPKADVSNLLHLIARQDVKVVRVKHEVQELSPIDVTSHGGADVMYITQHRGEVIRYFECHVKLDGPFCPELPGSSRDLYRVNRWYVTKRSRRPFDPLDFVHRVEHAAALKARELGSWRQPSVVAAFEYEAAIIDTNPAIDDRWDVYPLGEGRTTLDWAPSSVRA